MTARLRRIALAATATAGVALLGLSVQGVTAMDTELRSSVRALPAAQERVVPVVYDRRDCPVKDRVTVRGREV